MILLVHLAHAGTDAHSLAVPQGDDVGDPLAAWRPEVQVPGAWSMSGTLEEAQGLLSSWSADGEGQVTRTDLLEDLTALHLGGSLAVSRRVALALTVPTWLTSGSATEREWLGLGDLRLSAPLGIVLPSRDGVGFGLSLVPHVDAPTGDPERYLGSGTFGGGGVVAVGAGSHRFQLTGNLGADSLARDSLLGTDAGVAVLGSLAATWSPSGRFALHLEGIGRYGLAEELAARTPVALNAKRCVSAKSAEPMDCDDVAAAQAGSDKPAELLLDFDWAPTPGILLGAGGALGLTDAVGAPTWRGFLSVGWTTGKERPDRSTTTGRLTLESSVDDLSYDGTGSGSATATVRPEPGVTVRSQTWLDQDDRVLARGSNLAGVPAGLYTLEVRYHDGESVQTERHTIDIGYEVRWLPLDGAIVSEDGRSVRTDGPSAIARSYNRGWPEEEAWVEASSSTGAVGLSTEHGWPSTVPDAGWTATARTDGGPAAPGGAARVTRSGESVAWRTDAATDEGGSGVDGSLVAVAVVEGEQAVTGARASFPWRVAEPGPSCTPLGSGDLLGAPEGPLCAPPPEVDTLRVRDASGAILITQAVGTGPVELPVRLRAGMVIELLRDGVVVATTAVLP